MNATILRRNALRCAVFAAGATVLLCPVAGTAATPTYFYIQNNQADMNVRAINNAGDMAGEFTDEHGNVQAYLRTADGTITTFPIRHLGQVTALDDNDDMVGTYTSGPHAWFRASWTPAPQYWDIILKGKVAKATPLSLNVTSGEIVGYFVDKKGVTHGFTSPYPTASGRLSSSTVNYPTAAQTMLTTGNSTGYVAGQYQDAAGVWHGFATIGGTAAGFDYPNATGTNVSRIDDWDDIIGTYTVMKNGSPETVGYDFYGDTLADGSTSKTSFKALGVDAIPTALVTLNSGGSDFVLASPKTYTIARDNSTESFGKATSQPIKLDPDHCLHGSLNAVDYSGFQQEIAGFCRDDRTNEEVGFVLK